MIRTIADQYLAQNAGRRYPLADDTPAGVPDAAILDFRCTVRDVPPGSTARARLTNVATVGSDKRLTVTVDRAGTSDTLVFAIPLSMAADAPFTAYASDVVTGATGAMTVSAAVRSVQNGAKNLAFAWTTVVCDSLKVASLQSGHSSAEARDKEDPSGLNAAAALSGEIVLAEGRNAEPYLDGNRIRLDIFKGAGLGENCQSVSSGQTCDNVLFTINGERPGSDGDIRLVGEGGVTVTPHPESHSLTIKLDDVARNRLVAECTSDCNGG